MSRVDICLLGPSDATVLDRLAPEVFDHDVQPDWCEDFLADPRHHLVVARVDGVVVGMASAVDYIHPDKAPQLWINEIGVTPEPRRQGIGRRLMERLVELATELGCTEAWVLTDDANVAANRLYAAAGAEVPPARSLMYTFPIRRSR
jgi:aminoglycoside 6'-N-acetyltransferase I